MSWNTPDVYNQPEAFGLTLVKEIDDPNACYSFDIFAVWKHTDGTVYYGQNSGCSCPGIFENYTSLADLDVLTDETWSTFADHVAAWCDYCSATAAAEVAMLRTELMRAAAGAMS